MHIQICWLVHHGLGWNRSVVIVNPHVLVDLLGCDGVLGNVHRSKTLGTNSLALSVTS